MMEFADKFQALENGLADIGHWIIKSDLPIGVKQEFSGMLSNLLDLVAEIEQAFHSQTLEAAVGSDADTGGKEWETEDQLRLFAPHAGDAYPL